LKHSSCRLDGKENNFYSVLGCSLAVDKELFTTFDSIDPHIIAEDTVLYRRAELLNGIVYIAQPLVKWRQHSSSITQSGLGGAAQYLAWQLKWTRDQIRRIRQSERDRYRLGLTGSGFAPEHEKVLTLKILLIEKPLPAAALSLGCALAKQEVKLHEIKELVKILIYKIKVLSKFDS